MYLKLTALDDLQVTAHISELKDIPLPPNHQGEYQGTTKHPVSSCKTISLRKGHSVTGVTVVESMTARGQYFFPVAHPQTVGEILVTGPLEVQRVE